MAFVEDNNFTKGLRGGVGKQLVFRRYHSKTVVSRKPTPSTVPATPELQEVRDRFKAATHYAQAILLDSSTKAEYMLIARFKESHSAYVVAVGDYLNQTSLQTIQTRRERYKGQVRFRIQVALQDNYKGKEMIISLSNSDGAMIERGNAFFVFGDQAWQYVTTTTLHAALGIRINIQVKDRPGNTVNFERALF